MNENKDAESSRSSLITGRIIYFLLSIVEIILAFRFVLRLFGANPGSGFVSFIYSISKIFLAPFTAIFSSVKTEGLETAAVFEPSTLIAMAVYAVVAWLIVKLVLILSNRRDTGGPDGE